MRDTESRNRNHLDRYEIHKRVRDRLRRTEGVVEVRAEPSSMRPTRVRAVLDTETFLGQEYERERAELEVEWRPRSERDAFRVQYNEPGSPWSCGWHQDDDHEELGPCHFQVDHADWEEGYHEPGGVEDTNPMAVIEKCLKELRERVPNLPERVRED
ncbi:MAG: hypothetical protein U5J64_08520 [Halobacteriales archaeon]|nr:hypothetical protein [Halobacteriales archaeon]